MFNAIADFFQNLFSPVVNVLGVALLALVLPDPPVRPDARGATDGEAKQR